MVGPCCLLMADTRTFAVLKFLKSGTTLASIKVRLAKAAVDSRKVSAEVVLADKPEKIEKVKVSYYLFYYADIIGSIML